MVPDPHGHDIEFGQFAVIFITAPFSMIIFLLISVTLTVAGGKYEFSNKLNVFSCNYMMILFLSWFSLMFRGIYLG